MVKFDMRSGYHHLNIHSEHLGFSWIIDGKQKYFLFTVLPFGLCSAGHIFTKVVRTSVNYWRSQSFPIIVYLDTQKRCTRMAKNVLQNLLDSFFFLTNFEKSIFIPTKTLDGFKWNLEDGVIEVPKKKIDKIQTKI